MVKKFALLALLVVLVAGCTVVQESPLGEPVYSDYFIPNASDLLIDNTDLSQLGIDSSAVDCYTEDYVTSNSSPLAQYSFCNFTINNAVDTEVVIEVKRFTNTHDLNGSFQYESLHLRGFQGLIAENAYGDASRFYGNNESDVYYYHLWIMKELYLIHITSKGAKGDDSYIADIGRRMLSKFE